MEVYPTMSDKNQGLDKLRKLKAEIEKDLEKKTGRKRGSTAEKRKLTISDDLRKRLTENKTASVPVQDIKTLIDVEKNLSDLSLMDLKALIRDNIEKERNVANKENLKGLMDILNKNLKNADDKFSALVQNVKKDYA